jgi:hypothetical protein
MTLCCKEKDEKKEAKIASSQPGTVMWWMVVWGWLKRCGEKWWRRERERGGRGYLYLWACGSSPLASRSDGIIKVSVDWKWTRGSQDAAPLPGHCTTKMKFV